MYLPWRQLRRRRSISWRLLVERLPNRRERNKRPANDKTELFFDSGENLQTPMGDLRASEVGGGMIGWLVDSR